MDGLSLMIFVVIIRSYVDVGLRLASSCVKQRRMTNFLNVGI